MKALLKRAYEKFGAQLLAICRRYFPDLQTAEDMFQEGFLAAFKVADSFRGKTDAELYGWLRTIMVNTCLMRIRKKDVLRGSADVEYVQNNVSEDVSLERIDDNTLLDIISSLPSGERTVLNLFVFEEMTHKEIAARLGITERASISKMYRAKTMLAEKIREYEKE